MSLMGVDVGTTGVKAVVFSLDGSVLSSAYREYPLYSPAEGQMELDSAQVWEGTREVIAEAAGASGERVGGIGVTSQGEAFTPVTREGEILDRSMVSFDARAVAEAEELAQRIDPMKALRITGHPINHMYSLPKIMWWKKHRGDLYEKAWKLLFFEDFIIYKLCGKTQVDYSLAARSLAFDIQEKKLSPVMLDAAGVDGEKLSDPVASGTPCDTVASGLAKELGLGGNVAVATGGHDQPSGALGAGVTAPGLAIDATGTVECLCAAFASPQANRNMLKNHAVCYPHLAPGLYVTLGWNFTGGALLKWYRDTFAGGDSEGAYERIMAEAPEAPTRLLVLPHFTTTGTPYLDPNPTSAILGATLSTTRGEFVKALLEGITYEIRLNMELWLKSGIHVEELRAIGGGARSEVWLQLKADIFNRPVIAAEVTEAAALGAAISAGVATSKYRTFHDATRQTFRAGETFTPDPGRARIYDENFERYRNLYKTVKRLMS